MRFKPIIDNVCNELRRLVWAAVGSSIHSTFPANLKNELRIAPLCFSEKCENCLFMDIKVNLSRSHVKGEAFIIQKRQSFYETGLYRVSEIFWKETLKLNWFSLRHHRWNKFFCERRYCRKLMRINLLVKLISIETSCWFSINFLWKFWKNFTQSTRCDKEAFLGCESEDNAVLGQFCAGVINCLVPLPI